MIELGDTKVGGLSSQWTDGNDDPEKFKKQLVAQTVIWRQFNKILKGLYRNIQSFEYDFDKPNMDQRMIFAEGYKKALTDIHKLVPTQKSE